jgi:hypothetical protein
MLLSVSHHMEPAYGAFTRPRALDEQVGLIVTRFWSRSEPGAFLHPRFSALAARSRYPRDRATTYGDRDTAVKTGS